MIERMQRGRIRAKFEDGIYTFLFTTVKGDFYTVWTMRAKKGRKISNRHSEFAKNLKKYGWKVNKWAMNIRYSKEHAKNWIKAHEEHLEREGKFLYFIN